MEEFTGHLRTENGGMSFANRSMKDEAHTGKKEKASDGEGCPRLLSALNRPNLRKSIETILPSFRKSRIFLCPIKRHK